MLIEYTLAPSAFQVQSMRTQMGHVAQEITDPDILRESAVVHAVSRGFSTDIAKIPTVFYAHLSQ